MRVEAIECTVDYSGRVRPLSAAGEVPAQLVQYARSFLLLNRDSVQFLYWFREQWLAVRLERRPAGESGGAITLLTYGVTELPSGITRREVDILTLNALGLTNAEIAARLGTRQRTVSTQVERLLRKLDLPGRAGLAALAVDVHLFTLPIPGGAGDVALIAPAQVQQFAEAMDADPVVRARVGELTPGRRPLLVGTVAPLSGVASTDGQELVRGAAMAVLEINRQGGVAGRRLEHVVVDADMFDSTRVREAFTELFELRVDAITASYVSAENPFVMDLVADYGRPFLHTATFDEQVSLVEHDPARYGLIFQTCPSERFYAAGFVRFLTELKESGAWAQGAGTVMAVLAESRSTRIDDGLETALAEIDWRLVDTVTVPMDAGAWEEVARRVDEVGPTVVLVAHFIPAHIAVFQSALNTHGYRGLVHYVYGASIPEFRSLLRGGVNGVTWSTVTSRYADPLSESFQRDYTLRYGVEPGLSQASAAYDQVRLLAHAWADVGSADPARTARMLRSQPHRGLNGIYYFGGPGQAAQCYPDGTSDPSLGQALITYQYQDGVPVALSPAGSGTIGLFRPPAGEC